MKAFKQISHLDELVNVLALTATHSLFSSSDDTELECDMFKRVGSYIFGQLCGHSFNVFLQNLGDLRSKK